MMLIVELCALLEDSESIIIIIHVY